MRTRPANSGFSVGEAAKLDRHGGHRQLPEAE
jgi:hypothetical protein